VALLHGPELFVEFHFEIGFLLDQRLHGRVRQNLGEAGACDIGRVQVVQGVVLGLHLDSLGPGVGVFGGELADLLGDDILALVCKQKLGVGLAERHESFL